MHPRLRYYSKFACLHDVWRPARLYAIYPIAAISLAAQPRPTLQAHQRNIHLGSIDREAVGDQGAIATLIIGWLVAMPAAFA